MIDTGTMQAEMEGRIVNAGLRDAAAGEGRRLEAVVASYGEEAGPFDSAMRGYMMRTLEPFLGDGPCLQVGCSQGEQTELLAARFEDLTVVEPVAAFIARARARTPARVAFERSLAEDFHTNKRFGAVMLTHVLEHVDDPVAMLRRLGGLLTPDGSLCVVVPNAEAPSRRIAAKMGLMSHLEGLSDADRAAGHRRVYTLETLARDVEAAGLAAHHMGGIFFKPLANFQLDALMGGPLIGDAFMEACSALGAEHPRSCASVYVVAGKD